MSKTDSGFSFSHDRRGRAPRRQADREREAATGPLIQGETIQETAEKPIRWKLWLFVTVTVIGLSVAAYLSQGNG